MAGIDSEVSVVDWVIDYPESIAVFKEFAIDYCCAGKSVECACVQANANAAVVVAKLKVIVRNASLDHTHNTAGTKRPVTYWMERTPPGWLSRHTAETADPIRLAGEILERAQAVLDWMGRPQHERWDTFQLQTLSAALFNRYVTCRGHPADQRRPTVSLLQLRWPYRSEMIQCCVAELQQLLVAPLAVIKAVRLPHSLEDYPSNLELKQAEACLMARRDEFSVTAERLAALLQEFEAQQRLRDLPTADPISPERAHSCRGFSSKPSAQ